MRSDIWMRATWRGNKIAWKKVLDWLSPKVGQFKETLPGAAYDASGKCWVIPADCWDAFYEVCRRAGAQAESLGFRKGVKASPALRFRAQADVIGAAKSGLNSWQRGPLESLAEKGGILSFATGLGKSATILRAMALDAELSGEKLTALIVAPAIVHDHWASEVKRWIPQYAIGVAIISEGIHAPLAGAGGPQVIITSPELLPQIPVTPRRWLIADEGDAFKTAGTRRTGAIGVHREKATKCALLTATLVSREVDDLFTTVNLVWPGLFGKNVWAFRRRYMNVVPQIGDGGELYGHLAVGLREDRAEELASRLSNLVHMALHDDPDVNSRLPPINLSSRWLQTSHGWSGDWTASGIAEWQARVAFQKIAECMDIARESSFPVCFLTNLRETANALGEVIPNSVVAHGSTASAARMKKVTAAMESGAHLISTMHALGVGIDLTRYRRPIFVELYWTPRTVIQAMGRFRRLSSDISVSVDMEMLLLRGSPDEAMALRVTRRVEEQREIFRSGQSTDRFLDVLKGQTEAQAIAELIKLAANHTTADEYLQEND